MTTRAKVLRTAAAEIGYAEKPVNRTKYGAWYGMDGSAWCAMFVSWVAMRAGARAIIPRHAYTPSGAKWFKDRSRWYRTPKAGDLAYFRFPGGPARIHHVGFVEKVRSDGMLVTIEGNTSPADNRNGGMVMRRVRHPKYVVGYGRPKYTPSIRKYPGVVKRGAKGADVRWIQRRLVHHGHGVTVDGDFGDKTYAAVKRFRERRFRARPQTGNVGPVTWTHLARG